MDLIDDDVSEMAESTRVQQALEEYLCGAVKNSCIVTEFATMIQSNLVSDNRTWWPASLKRHPIGIAWSSYTPWLRYDNWAVFSLSIGVIQYELRHLRTIFSKKTDGERDGFPTYLSSFSRTGGALNHNCWIRIDCI